MMTNMKASELNKTEMNSVTGCILNIVAYGIKDLEKSTRQQEIARQQAAAAQTGAQAHGGGASGGW